MPAILIGQTSRGWAITTDGSFLSRGTKGYGETISYRSLKDGETVYVGAELVEARTWYNDVNGWFVAYSPSPDRA